MAGNRTREGRFAPGHSGNAAGRPRRKKSQKATQEGSAFDVLHERRIPVLMGGIEKQLTVEQALFYRTYQDALKGNRLAIRTVLKRIKDREARRAPCQRRGLIFRSEEQNPRNVDDALVALRIATSCPKRERENGRLYLELEPWAVALALARAKGPLLEDKKLRELKEHTRDAGSVTWPEEYEE